jgi:hypothetical protein
MQLTQFDIRVATAIGRIVMAYGRVDQQIYYQIGHLKTERFRRARNKASRPPPDEPIERRFGSTVKLYRRLCSELSRDDPSLMRDVDAFIRRLDLAVACRDDLVHGWVSYDAAEIGLPEKEKTRICVTNAHDINEFIKARNNTPPGKMPRADDYINVIYTFEQLEAVVNDFTRIYWDLFTLTDRAIMEFR